MEINKITLLFRVSLIIVAVFGILICALWYPFTISLTSFGIVDYSPTVEQVTRFWVTLSFYWVVSVPCFVVLFILWKISIYLKKNDFFTNNVVVLMKRIVFILLIDLFIFLIGNVVFLLLKWNDFAIIYFMITVLGLVVICFLYVGIIIIKKGIELKEDLEGTI